MNHEGRQQWPETSTESLVWHNDPDMLALASKSARRKAGGTYEAAVPLCIAERTVTLPHELAARVEELTIRLARYDARASQRSYSLPALLLRSESASSSQIEHLTSSVRNVALAEVCANAPHNAKLVAGNVSAMREALNAVKADGELDEEDILAAHRALVKPTGQSFGGQFRSEQVWIGGSALSPHGAEFVPPAAERVSACIADLLAYARRDDVQPIVHAAIFHAQFETIHPFVDGNGRTGRALLHSLLKRDGVLEDTALPLSAGLLHDVDAYMAALSAYRQGDCVTIVERLAGALELALLLGARAQNELDDVLQSWHAKLDSRADAAIHRLPALLVEQPVVDVSYIAHHLAVTQRTACNVVRRACELGILEPMGNRRRGEYYQAPELIAVLETATDTTAIRRTALAR